MIPTRVVKLKLDVEHKEPQWIYSDSSIGMLLAFLSDRAVDSDPWASTFLKFYGKSNSMKVLHHFVPMKPEWFTQLPGCQLRYIIPLERCWE